MRLKQEDVRREVTGPPKSAAFDAQDAPTRVAEGFAGKHGVGVEKLFIVNTPRGEYVAVEQLLPGRAAAERLDEIIPRAIAEIPWPQDDVLDRRFGTALHPADPLGGGVARRTARCVWRLRGVTAGAATSGHRFLGKSSIPVSGYDDYVAKLEKNYVLALPESAPRESGARTCKLATGKGLRVNEDAALSELVVYLNEYPIGDFRRASIPRIWSCRRRF